MKEIKGEIKSPPGKKKKQEKNWQLWQSSRTIQNETLWITFSNDHLWGWIGTVKEKSDDMEDTSEEITQSVAEGDKQLWNQNDRFRDIKD